MPAQAETYRHVENLFGSPLTITPEVLSQTPDIASETVEFFDGLSRRGKLQLFVDFVMAKFKLTDASLVPALVNEWVQEARVRTNGRVTISLSDILGRDITSGKLRHTKETAPGAEFDKANPYFRIGQTSHRAVVGFMRNGLVQAKEEGQPVAKQRSLLDGSGKGPVEMQLGLDGFPLGAGRERITPQDLQSLLREIQRIWNDMVNIYQAKGPTPRGLVELYWHANGQAEKLLESLSVFFGQGNTKRLLAQREDAGFVVLPAGMSWVPPLLESYPGGQQILFTELNALAGNTFGFGLGRMDAFVVSAIDGCRPSKSQQVVLARMAQERHPNPLSLLHALGMELGTNKIDSSVYELKFAIGDGHPAQEVLTEKDIKDGPIFQRYRLQVARYLVALSLTEFILNGGKNPRDVWDKERHGKLVFHLPHALREEGLILLSDEQREVFERIVERLPHAQKNALWRTIYHQRIFTMSTPLSSNTNGSRNLPSAAFGTQLSFPEIKTPVGLLQELVEHHKRFVDPEHIIQIVGRARDGKHIYGVHLDRLLAAISGGRIYTKNFTLSKGGLMQCPFPDHEDSTPSCNVRLGENSFVYCFGCGRYATIIPDSIPPGLGISVLSSGEIKRRFPKTSKVEIPAGHLEFMQGLQETLTRSFVGSPAEEYLRSRFIDTALARQHGAGYVSTNWVLDLLHLGYKYEDLVHYGVIGRSSNPRTTAPLVEFLRSRGFRDEDLMEEETDPKTHQTYHTYPSLVFFAEAVTFPLEFGQEVTNIYARSLEGKLHRKLGTDYTHIPHGGFNLGALTSDSPSVIIVEGVMCALTINQILAKKCLPPLAIALVGVKNHEIVERVAQANPRKVLLGLDYDKTGMESTEGGQDKEGIIHWFAGHGFKGEVFDLTGIFFPGLPLDLQDKDFNGWFGKVAKRHGFGPDDLPKLLETREVKEFEAMFLNLLV